MKINPTLRLLILTGLFAVPFIAFIISPSMLFPFITGKNFTFRILIEILFVLWVILALRDEKYLPKRSWILYSYIAFIIFMGLADFFGMHPFKSFWSNYERMEGFIAHIHFFLYFVVLSSTMSAHKMWDRFWATWVVVGVFMSFYGLLQIAGKIAINQGGVRLDGTFGNATYLAVFLMFTSFLTAFLMLRKYGKSAGFWILGSALILQLIVLYFTATRGDILGLIGGGMASALIIAIWYKGNARIRKASIGILVGILVLIGGFFLIRNASFVQNSPVLGRFAQLSISDIETQGRYYIWPMAIKGFIQRPILGWGQENFNYIFNANYNPAMYAQEQWFDRAHNMFLDWLVAGGLLVIIPYLALFYFIFWYLWKRDILGLNFLEKSVITGLMLAYIFQGLFVFDNLFSYLLFFSLLAYVHAHSSDEKVVLPNWMKQGVVTQSISVLLVILALFTLYFANIKPIEASQNLIDGMRVVQTGDVAGAISDFQAVFQANTFGSEEALEQFAGNPGLFLTAQASDATKVQYIQMAQAEFAKQLAQNPNDTRIRVFYGIFLRDIGQTDQSIVQLKKAAELSPTKQTVLFELGASYIAGKDYKDALNVLQTAYNLDTSDQDAGILYAVGAIYANDTTALNKVVSALDPQTVLFDDRIVSALAATGQYQELIKLFTARLQTDKGRQNIQNYFSLAVAYVDSGQVTQAVTFLRQLESANPTYKDQIEAYIKQITAGK
jgi:O-antigen ligase/cytochrome c-type biogenesis protein CcmH/NrfG